MSVFKGDGQRASVPSDADAAVDAADMTDRISSRKPAWHDAFFSMLGESTSIPAILCYSWLVASALSAYTCPAP